MSDSEEETFAELPTWAHIQKKTFTKWCNEQLKKRELDIADLQISLRDGLLLLNLVELLTQKEKATRHNKNPRIKPQMVENIGIALKILTDDGVKLVNIGNEDIYAGNMKLILGLIWTLILRYQIAVDFQNGNSEGKSAKKELMKWATDLVNALPGVNVRNFTTDWNNGIALCSMVEAVAPGLCPEFSSLDPKNALANAQLGLERAEEGLGVAMIIDAVDLINPDIDELSVLTYVSLLKNATPRDDIVPFDPLKVTIYGPGTDIAFVNIPTYFMVNTKGAGRGELKVTIFDSNGEELSAELEKDDEGVVKVQYVPLVAGVHNFNVTYATHAVPNGQFKVRVVAPSDATKVRLSGDGMTIAYVGKEAHFTVDAEGAGEGPLGITLVSPDGKVPCEISDLGNSKYDVKYVPQSAGPMDIVIKWCDAEIAESPLRVEVLEDLNPLKVIIGTVGLENCVAKEPVRFTVCTEGAGNGDLQVEVLDNDNSPLKVTIANISPDNQEVCFTPLHAGPYKVNVTWSSMPVPNGEIDLEVKEPIDLSKCVISELGNPCVDTPTVFTVDLSNCGPVGEDDLAVSIIGPDNKPMEVTIGPISPLGGKLNGLGVCFVLSNGKLLSGPDGKPLVGPNCRSLEGPDGKPLVAIGPDGRSLVGPDRKPLLGPDGKPLVLSDVKPLIGPDGKSNVDPDGQFRASSRPDGMCLLGPDGAVFVGPNDKPLIVGPGNKTLVGPDGSPVLGSDDKPLILSDGGSVIDPDGVSFVLSDGKPLLGPNGEPLVGPNCRSLEGPDGKPLVAIGPDGRSLVGPDRKPLLGPDGKPLVLSDGKPLIGPDCKSLVGPDGKLLVDDDGKSLCGPDGKPLYGPNGKPLEVGPDGRSLVGPDGKPLAGSDGKPLLLSDGKSLFNAKPIVGPNGVPLDLGPDGKALVLSDGKPFLGPDGEPLELGDDGKALVLSDGKPFLGPDDEPLTIKYGLAPAVYQVSYTAKEVGPHRVNVKVQDTHVPGSVFSVHSVDPRKVLVTFEVPYQQWLKSQDMPVGEPVEIALSLTDAGPGQLGIQLSAPPGSGTDCHASEISPGKMVVMFTPTSVGEHLVNLTFDDQLIPHTPVTVRVIPKSNPGAVKVYGDGLSNGNVGDPARFTIDTNGAGQGSIELKINGPRGELDAPLIEVGKGLYEVTYIPQDEGIHVIMVKFADQHVPGSAFRSTIEKGVSPDSVVAYGKGLEEGTPGTDNEFYVDTSKAGEGELRMEILGPAGVIEPVITNITNHHYKIVYAVPAEGDYTVNVTWSDVNIPKSPFNINVRTPFNPSSVLCQGPGLMMGTVGKVSLFEVDCRAAGNAPLNINVEDDDQNLIPVKVSETQPNCYDVSFIPQTSVPHFVNVLWNDFNIRGSPFKINVQARPEKDINLGGEGKIRVYYSTTTSSEQIRHNCRFLQSLLERKKVHLRPDFEPWIPIDIGMDREERNKIFEKAECRKTPMLFIDDCYVGGYDEVLELDEVGEMDRLLSYCTLKYRNLQTVEEARKADELARRAEQRDSS